MLDGFTFNWLQVYSISRNRHFTLIAMECNLRKMYVIIDFVGGGCVFVLVLLFEFNSVARSYFVVNNTPSKREREKDRDAGERTWKQSKQNTNFCLVWVSRCFILLYHLANGLKENVSLVEENRKYGCAAISMLIFRLIENLYFWMWVEL